MGAHTMEISRGRDFNSLQVRQGHCEESNGSQLDLGEKQKKVAGGRHFVFCPAVLACSAGRCEVYNPQRSITYSYSYNYKYILALFTTHHIWFVTAAESI